jgi:hypothetical protein
MPIAIPSRLAHSPGISLFVADTPLPHGRGRNQQCGGDAPSTASTVWSIRGVRAAAFIAGGAQTKRSFGRSSWKRGPRRAMPRRSDRTASLDKTMNMHPSRLGSVDPGLAHHMAQSGRGSPRGPDRPPQRQRRGSDWHSSRWHAHPLDFHRNHARFVPLARGSLGDGWQNVDPRRRIPRYTDAIEPRFSRQNQFQ